MRCCSEAATDYGSRLNDPCSISAGKARDSVGRVVRRRLGLVLGASALLPRATASWSDCRRWFCRCTGSSGPGLILLPFMAASGLRDLGGVGWRRGILLTAFGGLPLALWSYFGYVFVPLGHGAIIQPSCAAVGGLILARIVLKEALPLAPHRRRADHRARALRHRRRSAEHHGRAGHHRRPVVRRRGQFLRDLRHAAAALPDCADAGGRRHQHLVARRPAAACCSASTTWWRPDFGKI